MQGKGNEAGAPSALSKALWRAHQLLRAKTHLPRVLFAFSRFRLYGLQSRAVHSKALKGNLGKGTGRDGKEAICIYFGLFLFCIATPRTRHYSSTLSTGSPGGVNLAQTNMMAKLRKPRRPSDSQNRPAELTVRIPSSSSSTAYAGRGDQYATSSAVAPLALDGLRDLPISQGDFRGSVILDS